MAPRNENAIQTALAYFKSVGWTTAHAAGIVANLYAESGLRPDAVGDGGAAYGIAQWHPDRQRRFVWFANKDIHGSTLEEQLAFVHAELNQWEKTAGDALRKCTTAAEAGACVSRMYERPADRDGEAAKRAELATSLAGEQPAAPIEDKSTTYQPTGGNMGTALMLLPLLAQWVPQIMSLIKPDSKSTAKDAQVAQTVLNVAAEAAGVIQKGEQATAANVGATVDMLQKDPELAKKVQEAVVTHPEIMGVLQIGEGGIQGARDFGKAIQVAEKPFWFNPTFWITVGLFPMMYMIAYSVLFTVAPDSSATVDDVVKLAWYQKIGFDPNTRAGLVNLIVGFVFGGVVGVWFGTSYGSQRKTELAASATEQAVGK